MWPCRNVAIKERQRILLRLFFLFLSMHTYNPTWISRPHTQVRRYQPSKNHPGEMRLGPRVRMQDSVAAVGAVADWLLYARTGSMLRDDPTPLLVFLPGLKRSAPRQRWQVRTQIVARAQQQIKSSKYTVRLRRGKIKACRVRSARPETYRIDGELMQI
jgi:hypothetical protein